MFYHTRSRSSSVAGTVSLANRLFPSSSKTPGCPCHAWHAYHPRLNGYLGADVHGQASLALCQCRSWQPSTHCGVVAKLRWTFAEIQSCAPATVREFFRGVHGLPTTDSQDHSPGVVLGAVESGMLSALSLFGLVA